MQQFFMVFNPISGQVTQFSPLAQANGAGPVLTLLTRAAAQTEATLVATLSDHTDAEADQTLFRAVFSDD